MPPAHVPNAYFVLWPRDWCQQLEKAQDFGPLEVVYGGPHTSVPSLGKVLPGDVIYPVAVRGGRLFLLGRLPVAAIEPAEDYLARLQLPKPLTQLWDTTAPQLLAQQPALGHRIPRSCVDTVALGPGTCLRYDIAVPAAVVAQLRFGPEARQEKPLPMDASGSISHIHLQGHFRRLSAVSAALVAEWMLAIFKLG